MKLIIAIVYSLLSTVTIHAATFSSLKVGDKSPIDPSASLEVKSTTGALLAPRMTTTQKNAITPTNGDLVYDLTLNAFSGYINGAWAALGGGGGGGITRSISNISSNTTGGSTALVDYVYLVSGTTTFTLPTAVGNLDQYTVKRVGSGTVTIATTSAQTIDGSTTVNLTVINQSLEMISNGSNWNIK